jgi:hypothetical protein
MFDYREDTDALCHLHNVRLDGVLDGSTDSEEDNEIPFPRLKKKVHWFQNPANLQL